ncbi:MAG: DNRLRE domain-containing protein [Pseudomonadota bacterium]
MSRPIFQSMFSRFTACALAATLSLASTSTLADVLAGWNVSGQTAWGVSPLGATSSAANLTVGGLTRGVGVSTSNTAASRAWGGHDWQNTGAANAVSGNDYATFTVTAATGYQVSFSSISKFDYRRSGTGPANGVLQYQIGSGAFADIATLNYSSTSSSGASLAAIDLSGVGALQNVPAGTTVTFRIVNYGGTSSSGTWYIYDVANSAANDLVVEGTVSTAVAINGACGSDNGQTLAATAPTNLCTAGTPGSVSGSGHPWTWDCAGSGGGSTVSCSATIQSYTLNFAAGTGGSLTGTTPQTVDHGASASAVTANPSGGYSFVDWTGTNGFVTTTSNPLTVGNVTASQTITANFTNAPIAGVCGAANGQQRATAPVSDLCATGTPSAVAGSGPWTWSCAGINGGAAASCSASLDTTAHYHDFAPIADAQVAEYSGTSGTGTSMYIASANGGSFGNQRAWTAFDLAGEIPPGATVTSAKLRLYLFKADNEGDVLPVDVHASNDDSWTETGITWGSQPTDTGTPLSSLTLGSENEYDWIEFDVTAHVQDRLNLSDERINLMVKAATEGASQWASYAFDTREFNTSYAPRLRVEYSGGAWPDDRINIIHVNDMHSRLTTHDYDFPDGTGEAPALEEAGGAAYVASRLMALKAANPNSLVLDAGDISEGNPLGDLRVNGGQVDYLVTLDAQLKTLGGRGLDAIVIGNHDVRDAQMLTNMQASGLPFLAVNMLNYGATVPTPSAWPAANTFRPYVIVNTTSSAGTPTRVAVLGYLTDDSAILSASTEALIEVKETRWTSSNANHVKLKDWVSYLRKPVAQGGEGADVVVLLSHIGHRRYNSGDEILLGDGDVTPPDLVVAGHWHTWGKTVWQPSNLNHNTAVVEAASYGQYVGEVQLTPQGEYLGAQKHPVKPGELTPNAAVQTLVNTLIAEYDAQTDKPCVLPPAVTGRASANQSCPLDHVVGHSAVDLRLDKDKWFTLSEFPWSGDNAAGEWIADATVWKLGQLGVPAQLALQSGGGVRRDVKAGPVTYLDIYETYPWTDDQIRVVTLTSADVWAYLESHYVGSSISKGWQVTADDGVVTAITYDADGAGPLAPVALSRTDTATTWQVAISEYMFLHDDWINESGGEYDFSTKPNTAYTQSIRDSVVEYTAQFGASNPMTIEGPRYVLNTELAGGFKAVVTMVADAENEPYFEGVFVRLIEALPETVARRTSYGLATLVNPDGSINPAHEFAETMLYRSHLGFPDGMLKVGDIIEVWGEGGFFAGNPQLVDQESVYAPGQEFKRHGSDPALAQPEFKAASADFFDEAHENRLVKFRAVRTGDKTVQDANGVTLTIYKEGGYYTIGKLPGTNGDLLELVGIQTQRTGSDPERRFRLREATVVAGSGTGGGYLPFSAVNAVSPSPTASSPITLTASANDASTGGAGTLSLAPVADAQVASGNPTTNYGSSTSMYVQSAASGFGNERAWLRFDLSGLPAGATVSASRLKLYQWRPAGTALPVEVRGSSDTGWSESAITWNTQPAYDATVLDTESISATGTWYTWDLGTYANGRTAVSLVAKPVTEDANPASTTYAFDAKEYGSYTPALEVDYTAPLSSASVVSVQFFYRFAPDGLAWGAWTAIGTDTTPGAWDMSFNFPQGAGHYQFYSIATDNDGNVQPTPLNAQSSVVYNPSLLPQSISFGSLPPVAIDDSPITIGASASSGLAVVFSSTTPAVCSVSGNSVTLLATGTCTLAADQPGNATYAAAPQVVQSFAVLLGQSVGFAPLADRTLGSGSFVLVASSSSGLAVVFSSTTPGVCTVSGTTVTLVASGTCSIAADQPGNATYAAAATVVQSFAVTGAVAEDGDVPLPPWALGLLGAALLGAIRQRARRAAV